MSRPLLSVRNLYTESQLPKKLERGRIYFIADEQCFIIDMGDGRGPVKYGDKPGPQGQAGEPIPSLQGQIDELSYASITQTLNLYNTNKATRADIEHLAETLSAELSGLKSENENNANAVLQLLIVMQKKFEDYDTAIGLLAKTLANFYPESWGGKAGDGTNTITTGEILSSDGKYYTVDESYYDGDTGVVTLTLYEPSRVSTLKEGDIVEIDSGYFVVNSISNSGSSGIISLTLYQN